MRTDKEIQYIKQIIEMIPVANDRLMFLGEDAVYEALIGVSHQEVDNQASRMGYVEALGFIVNVATIIGFVVKYLKARNKDKKKKPPIEEVVQVVFQQINLKVDNLNHETVREIVIAVLHVCPEGK